MRLPAKSGFIYIIVAVFLLSVKGNCQTITSLNPNGGASGATVTISGLQFGASQASGTVFLGPRAATVTSWNDSTITVVVPSRAATGNFVVRAGSGTSSNGALFTVVPAIADLTPNSAPIGSLIAISGSSFGGSTGSVSFNGVNTPLIVSWSPTSVIAAVPTGAASGNVVITSSGGTASNPVNFTVVPAPIITALSPNSGSSGAPVTIQGSNFGSSQGSGSVTFNGAFANINSWSDTTIVAVVPSGATGGNVVVTPSGGVPSNSLSFSINSSILNGSFSPTVTAVTLTSLQALDWEHWGTSSDNPLVRMDGVTALLSDFTAIGGNVPAPFTGGETEYLWTDGNPLLSAERTVSGVTVGGTGNGFHLSVPADISARTLVLYVGVNNGQSQLTASLSDGSASSFVDSSLNSGANNFLAGTYSIDFRATQPGQTLNLDYVLLNDQGNGTTAVGQVMLDSAELFPHLPVVAMMAPADGQIFNQATSINIAASASQIDTALAKVDLLGDSQVLLELTSPPYSLSATGLSAGDHLLSASATDANGLTTTSDPVLVAQIQGGGMLTGSTSTPANVDLSAGTSDWVHWGNTTPANNLDRKAGIPAEISDLTLLANGSDHPFDASVNSGTSFSWTSGSPTDSQSGTATDLQMRGYKNGFKMTVAADTTARTLNLYVASGHGQSTLRASLSDGSAAPFVSVSSATKPFAETLYTIQFQAASAGQKLTITDQVTRDDGFAFVALESASVSDQNPPQISSVSPATAAPGAQITISGSNFGPAQGSAQVTLGGATVNVLSWSDNSITATVPLAPSGPVIVSRGLANSNGVPFTVILPPPPSIGFIRPNVGGEGTAVTIFGSNFGSVQNNSTLTFNGLAASPVFWSDGFIVVPAPVGVHSGPVVVTTVSGASNGVVFTFSPGIRFAAQPVYVTPDETNLEVGSSTVFRMVDPSGAPVTDATWKVDRSTLADISVDLSTPDTGRLEALAPGEVTITGVSSLGTAKAKATIYAVGQLPAGTAAWSFYPQVQDNFFEVTVKSRRNNPEDPFMYLSEVTDNLPTVSALDESGRSQWRVTLNPIAPSNTDIFPIASPATTDGGVLIQTNESDPNGPGEATGFYRLGTDGKQLWTYSVPGVDTSGPAIAQDGTILFWGTANTNFGLLALDDTTGQLKMNLNPLMGDNISDTSSEQPGVINPDRTPVDAQHPWKPCSAFFPPGQFDPPNPSGGGDFSFQPVIGTDGSVYVVETVVSSSFNYDTCLLTQNFDPNPNDPPSYFIDTISGQLQFAETLQLHRITQVGQVVTTQLGSVSYSGTAKMSASGFTVQWAFTDTNGNAAQLPAVDFDEVIPNADGGALVTWAQRLSAPGTPFQGFFTNIVNNAPVLNSPLPFPGSTFFSAFGNMAVNDQGTMFLDHFGLSVTAFDLGTGNLKWSVPGSLVVLSDDGGAFIKDSILSQSGSVQAVDLNGNPGTDSLILGNFATYMAEGMFEQNGPNGSIQGVSSESDQLNKVMAGPWPVPGLGTPLNEAQAIDVNLKEVRQQDLIPGGVRETENCTGFDRGQLKTDLAALMAPVGTTEMLPGANGTLSSQVTPASNVVSMRNNTGHTVTLIQHIPPFGQQPADTTIRVTIDPQTIPADGQYHDVRFTGLTPSDVNRPVKIEVFDTVTSQNLGDILQVDVKSWHRWFIDYYAISELSGRLQPVPPNQDTLQAQLDRIFRPQANLGFTVRNAGVVLDHYDVSPSNGNLHVPHSGDAVCQLGWIDSVNGTAFSDNTLCTDDTELTPMYHRLIDSQRSASHGQPIDIDNPDTFYLLYFQKFDANNIGGFADPDLLRRRMPAVVHTDYDPDLPNTLDHDRFIAVASAHEIGHKLGIVKHHEAPEPNASTYLLAKPFQIPRPGAVATDATKYPCRLARRDWNKTNYVYPDPR
ncbi:MAG TPA: IPT/TIG domain-containing protein [Candidatus Angelobacter sp.]|nr:IPT/TIG domain-containing protein [Candidatus Angelobacter sp.]